MGVTKIVTDKVIKHVVKKTFGQPQPASSSRPPVDEVSRPNATSSQSEPIPPATLKKKKNKYNIPPGLTKNESKVLKAVKKRASLYDEGFCSCCCCRVGLEPILGLIPVIGDFAGTFLAIMLVKTAQQADLPKYLVSKMMVNVLIDFMLGLIPLLGDLADFIYKCNTRNALLLHEYLADRAKNRSMLEEGAVEIIERLPPIDEAAGYNERILR